MDKAIEPATQTLLNNGVLGSLVILLIAGVIALFWVIINLNKARIKDWEKMGELVANSSAAIAGQNSASEARNRLLETSIQSQQILAAQQIQLIKDVGALQNDQKDWQKDTLQEITRMKEGMLQRGVTFQ